MISIVGMLTTIGPGYRWTLSTIPEPEQTEGFVISFLYTTAAMSWNEALRNLAVSLTANGVSWLRPRSSLNEWLIDLDGVRGTLADLMPLYPWLRGVARIAPVVKESSTPPAIKFYVRQSEMEARKEGVFISHISAEAEIASELKQFIKTVFGEDFKVFVSSDYVSIRGGDFWFERIVDALKSSEVVLVLLSKESVDRRWINLESGVGLGAGAQVIPIVMKTLSKGEVGPPLSNLQVRGLHDPKDVQEMLKDIELRTGATGRLVDSALFAAKTEGIAKGLPSKGIGLRPVIEPTVQPDFLLMFELYNTGSQDVELLEAEAAAPKAVINPDWWHPSFDPNVLESYEEEIEGERYLILRYKAYDGLTLPAYGHVDRLPRVASRGMTPRILKPLKFSIRKSAAAKRKSTPIRYKISGIGINAEEQVTPLDEIPGFNR